MDKSKTQTELWYSDNENDWLSAEEKYWKVISPKNLELEKYLEEIDPEYIKSLKANEFYTFLYDKYYVWKYTQKNRLATTRIHLQKHLDNLSELDDIKNALFEFDKNQIQTGLETAKRIKGLGVAGASGLLSILFPKYFGTVDQFVVKTLLEIDDLPERNILKSMHAESLSIKDGVILERVVREKALDLNKRFNTDYWTPRKVDKVLWATR